MVAVLWVGNQKNRKACEKCQVYLYFHYTVFPMPAIFRFTASNHKGPTHAIFQACGRFLFGGLYALCP